MASFIKRQSPVRILAAGFALVILIGSLLLCLPFSVREGASVSYIDALYISTSAVCVTGLATVDPGSTFSAVGQFVLALLIQMGGLGIAVIGNGIFLAIGKRLDLKSRNVLREAMNVDTGKGMPKFIKRVFLITMVFELTGALFCLPVFMRDYEPLHALGISLFHSISSFNNAGLDILGTGQNLVPYSANVLLNTVTCILIVFGGIGFLVMGEVSDKRFRWKKLSMHTKTVITVTATLIVAGTLLLKLTSDMTWLESLFQSITSRTAGFSTYPTGNLTNGALMIIMLLMFVGASPGSTGGGVKTTTLFVLLKGIGSSATNRGEKAFHYTIPSEAFRKAAVIVLIGLGLVSGSVVLFAVMEPDISLRDLLFETISAFSTTGLSTGISADLCLGSKLLSILLMYIGRLGPLTIASLWYFSTGDRVSYPRGNIIIG